MDKLKDFQKKYLSNVYVLYFLWAFCINFLIEELARKGIGGLTFLFQSPLVFLYNTLLIFMTLSLATLFKRRRFVVVVISMIWLIIGITNGIILMERMTPFTVKDLDSVLDGATIITNYFSIKQIILMAVGILILVAGLVFLWLKAPKQEIVTFKKNLAIYLIIIVCTIGASAGLVKMGVLHTFFGNLAYAYRDYGVPYCFTNTWLNTGIKKSVQYSPDKISSIAKDVMHFEDGVSTLPEEDVDNKYPNILFLQLESFVDPELFNNIKLSQDAMPYYRSLMENYSSGSLTVPACGAGTANTEFEVMTGLSVKFFGPGEYPFKSVLKDKPAESIARVFKSMGYSSQAIHNHRALFYNRNKVFANIGYDNFTSVEYMSDVPKTPKNWAKDSILTEQIMYALNSTPSKDYVYTISVQGHGKYPVEQLIFDPAIEVVEAPTEDLKWKYEYYVNQVYEMDQFVKDLTDALSEFNEDVVLVMYGDHIPALDIKEETYDGKDLYQTQYVIWDNFGLEKEDKDITTYELAADVLDRVGIHKGTTIKYHQNADHSSPDYLDNLQLLGYDMLYGDCNIYGGKNIFTPTDLRMGMKYIKIDEIVNVGDQYYIKGRNFTEYSKITLDGETLKTIYLSPKLLGLLEEVDLDDVDRLKVSQIDKSNKEIVSTTE